MTNELLAENKLLKEQLDEVKRLIEEGRWSMKSDKGDYERGLFNAFEYLASCIEHREAQYAEPFNKQGADGCKGCAFESVEEWEMPCKKCKRNCKDYWRAKDGNNT